MKGLIILIVILALGILGYYMFFKSNPASNITQTVPTQTNENPTGNSLEGPAVQVEVLPQTGPAIAVSIKNFSFSPATLDIPAGTQVTWTNNDNVAHTVTSDTGSVLSSTTLSAGQSYSFTFPKAGVFSYHCALHPSMKGTVVVTAK